MIRNVCIWPAHSVRQTACLPRSTATRPATSSWWSHTEREREREREREKGRLNTSELYAVERDTVTPKDRLDSEPLSLRHFQHDNDVYPSCTADSLGDTGTRSDILDGKTQAAVPRRIIFLLQAALGRAPTHRIWNFTSERSADDTDLQTLRAG
jgi:hypothetical protein